MPREESHYPADWLRIAEKDLQRVHRLLGLQDPEAAGFYLQQAIEKFLKAFLLSKGWQLQRIHDLEPLLNAALRHDPSFEKYRAIAQRITGFYFVERYPFMIDSGLTDQDVRDALAQIGELAEIIRVHMKE
jgi:HEPN domain-containing protein